MFAHPSGDILFNRHRASRRRLVAAPARGTDQGEGPVTSWPYLQFMGSYGSRLVEDPRCSWDPLRHLPRDIAGRTVRVGVATWAQPLALRGGRRDLEQCWGLPS